MPSTLPDRGLRRMFTLKKRLDLVIAELESQISELLGRDCHLAVTARILLSVRGIGQVASSTQIAELPALGAFIGEEAAAPTGLAPVAHNSGALRGKRTIAGGRRALRHVLFQAARDASHQNPTLKAFVDRLQKVGKPNRVIIAAFARKLVIIANARCKRQQK